MAAAFTLLQQYPYKNKNPRTLFSIPKVKKYLLPPFFFFEQRFYLKNPCALFKCNLRKPSLGLGGVDDHKVYKS
ncbi:hypothetical protein GDO78_015521 [Eleutherodactylus coqui]|uniref:Uncharacterized protein n=1 Tax=Eleutherodactylus coqui TaxID=57060 RepID=A0A8J6EDP1_ELECQ|nr:hypothetical protein GDO78_015521 [Eleutherodactylus coqui]